MYKNDCITGRINSLQSFGAADGPGVRYIVFMQGCPLRCICCHNPETWQPDGGTEMTADELYENIIRCRNYFGKNGGITVSGGEPLIQARFLVNLFAKMKQADIHTALDTSGCVLNNDVKELLDYTDLVLLDYKYVNESDYRKYTGCEKSRVDDFLGYLNNKKITTWIRQVIIPGYNDSAESVKQTASLKKHYPCIEKTELLPFRKLCEEKYKALNIPFKLSGINEPTADEMNALNELLKI